MRGARLMQSVYHNGTCVQSNAFPWAISDDLNGNVARIFSRYDTQYHTSNACLKEMWREFLVGTRYHTSYEYAVILSS